MKKTSTYNDSPSSNSATPRESSKGNTRQSKKTIHAIAPADSREAPFEIAIVNDFEPENEGALSNDKAGNRRSPKERRKERVVPYEQALEFSCKLLHIAVQRTTWTTALADETAHELDLNGLIDKFENDFEITSTGEARERLVGLLEKIQQGALVVCSSSVASSQGTQLLTHAIHTSIASLVCSQRFVEAVETNTQRAIYQFAYGLTHEINNPLANIAARAQQLIPSVAAESDKRSLATIVDQTMRAHEMLAEMMRVVQPRSLALRVEDVVPIVRQAVESQMSGWTHAKIQCESRLSPKSLYSAVERASLSEAISSLVQNALQVCRPNDRIEVVCEEVSEGHLQYGPWRSAESDKNSDAAQGKRIRLLVRDTGPGMSSHTSDRAWDLYYSGREHGRGLGISLANVRRIVDAHQGMVWIESAPNAGCSVEIRLPRLPDPTQPRRTVSV